MSDPLRVAVTGASGYIGTRLIQRLSQMQDVEKVLAIDVRPFAPSLPKVSFYQRDVTRPLNDLFQEHRVNLAIPLAFILRPGHNRKAIRGVNVGGLANVLKACESSEVAQIVYISSATVYGAHPDNPPLLSEDYRLRPVNGFQYSEDKVQVEGLLEGFAKAHPEVCMTVFRACVVMGPNSSNFISVALSKPVLVAVGGSDPLMQFLYEDDLVDIICNFVGQKRPGVFNLAGEGPVRYSDLARLSGQKLLHLPVSLIYPLTQLTWNLRIQKDSPSCGLDFIRYPWVVSTEKLRVAGVSPHHSSLEALAAFIESRPGRGSKSGRE